MNMMVRVKFKNVGDHTEFPDHTAEFKDGWLILRTERAGRTYLVAFPAASIEKVEVMP